MSFILEKALNKSHGIAKYLLYYGYLSCIYFIITLDFDKYTHFSRGYDII